MSHTGRERPPSETDDIDLQFACRLRSTREAGGISQTALAERLGVSAQAVQKWESGASFPRLSRLYQLAGALGVKVSSLLPDDFEVATSIDANDIRTLSLAQRLVALPDEKRRAISVILDVSLN